ncbi:MAG: hypothetical protein PUC46_06195 [Lachnospiraceae bacterium]|nr:hypothetical protein [Lachnospiraceae bacterium]
MKTADDEMTINLKDMFFQLCLNWKKCLAGFLIGLVIGFALMALMGRKTINYDQNIAEAKENLLDAEAADVEREYDQYKSLEKSKNAQVDYMNHSILMQVDASRVPTMTRQYSVIGPVDLSNVINSSILSSSDFDQIAKIVNDPDSDKYVNELVTINTTSSDSSKNVDLKGSTVRTDADAENGTISYEYQNTINVAVESLTKDQCSQIMDVVEKAVQNVLTHYQLGKESDPVLVSDSYNELISATVNQMQQDQTDKLTQMTTSISSFGSNNSFSSDEQAYFDALKAKDHPTKIIVHRMRYIAGGAAAGLFFVLAWVVLRYLTADLMMTAEDVEELAGTSFSENFISEDTGILVSKNISRFIRRDTDPVHRWLSGEQKAEMFTDELAALLEKDGRAGSVYLVKNGGGEYNEKINEVLKRKFTAAGLQVVEGTPATKAEDMNALLSGENFVLSVGLHRSPRTEVEYNVGTLKRHGKKIIGVVTTYDYAR